MASREPAVYVIAEGSVDIFHRSASGLRTTMCSLVAGGVFGNATSGSPELVTAQVGKAACKVFQATGADFSLLPLNLRQSIAEHLAQTRAWHEKRIGEAAGSPLAAVYAAPRRERAASAPA